MGLLRGKQRWVTNIAVRCGGALGAAACPCTNDLLQVQQLAAVPKSPIFKRLDEV